MDDHSVSSKNLRNKATGPKVNNNDRLNNARAASLHEVASKAVNQRKADHPVRANHGRTRETVRRKVTGRKEIVRPAINRNHRRIIKTAKDVYQGSKSG